MWACDGENSTAIQVDQSCRRSSPNSTPRATRILRVRRWKRVAFGSVLVVTFLCVAASHSVLQSGLATDKARFHQRTCRGVEVVAGDTLRVTTDSGAAETVKLIGVDANASPAAADLVKVACRDGVLLYLQDVPTRDGAGELLAYIFLPDGSLLNETADPKRPRLRRPAVGVRLPLHLHANRGGGVEEARRALGGRRARGDDAALAQAVARGGSEKAVEASGVGASRRAVNATSPRLKPWAFMRLGTGEAALRRVPNGPRGLAGRRGRGVAAVGG